MRAAAIAAATIKVVNIQQSKHKHRRRVHNEILFKRIELSENQVVFLEPFLFLIF